MESTWDMRKADIALQDVFGGVDQNGDPIEVQAVTEFVGSPDFSQ